MSTCGYFERNTQCEKRNFFIVAAAAIGNPTLAIFALGQDRFWATLGAIQAFGVMGGLTFNRPYTPVAYYRDAVFCEQASFISSMALSSQILTCPESLCVPSFPFGHGFFARGICSTIL